MICPSTMCCIQPHIHVFKFQHNTLKGFNGWTLICSELFINKQCIILPRRNSKVPRIFQSSQEYVVREANKRCQGRTVGWRFLLSEIDALLRFEQDSLPLPECYCNNVAFAVVLPLQQNSPQQYYSRQWAQNDSIHFPHSVHLYIIFWTKTSKNSFVFIHLQWYSCHNNCPV